MMYTEELISLLLDNNQNKTLRLRKEEEKRKKPQLFLTKEVCKYSYSFL